MAKPIDVDVWVRGENDARTVPATGVSADPSSWTDADVKALLTEMLQALDRAGNPRSEPAPVVLRGFSWIVSPFEGGGYTVAVEIQLGAAAAGPFDVDQRELESTITRVLAEDRLPPRQAVVH